ncbi:MAG: DNA-protecting protein DprA [Burkholderiaceae bacterium]|nr:DNA-protecting protein DprA [Burkholderiaceae bacterium]
MPLDAAARDEYAWWLRLTLTPGIGPAAARRLLEAFGLPEDVFRAARTRIAAVLDAPRAAALLADDDAREAKIAAALDWARSDENHLLALADPRYPQPLLQIGDPPPLLYVRGSPEALCGDLLAIVGSRHATPGGEANAHDFARALADEGLAICSGLARGIDAAAHRGALEGRAGTIAVVGTGVDRVYPAAHRQLAHAIAQRGAIVSELPLGTEVQRANFPRRNRIIAGLSLGVLVVEAAPHSGSLITARHAAESGREVMAIPGSIHSPVARGCHRLIREGAKLVESAEDVLAELRGQMRGRADGRVVGRMHEHTHEHTHERTHEPRDAGAPPRVVHTERDPGAASAIAAASQAARSASPAARTLLQALGWDPVDVDTLIARSALPAGEVAEALLELELAGLAQRWIDGRYVRAGHQAGRQGR